MNNNREEIKLLECEIGDLMFVVDCKYQVLEKLLEVKNEEI